MTNEHWTEPPGEDALLKWRYCDVDADIGFGSTHQPFVNMAQSGISSGGNTQTDDRLVRRNICTVTAVETYREPAVMKDGTVVVLDPGKRDKESPAAKLRRVDGYLAALTPRERDVMWEAYGPNYSLWREQHRERLGQWPGVVLIAPLAASYFADWITNVSKRAARAREALGELPALRCRPQERKCGRCRGSGAEARQDVFGKRVACEECKGAGLLVVRSRGDSRAVPVVALGEVVKAEQIVASSREDQAARLSRFGWLLHEASTEQLKAIRKEADAELFRASNKWRDEKDPQRKDRRKTPPVLRHVSHADAMAALDERERLAGR